MEEPLDPKRPVGVIARTECKIFGIRRFPGESFTVPADREADLTSGDLLISERTAAILWGHHDGRVLSPAGIESNYPAAPVEGRPVRVLQLTHYDPGCAAYRYHSAANTVPGVASVFVRFYHNNPYCDLRQFDGQTDLVRVRSLLLTADVIHCHMDYAMLFTELHASPLPHQRLARTYHGSIVPGDPPKKFIEPEVDKRNRALVFGARPYHHRLGVPHWLPIPMPVADYETLARESRGIRAAAQTFRVAHSPTRRAIKGTDAFVAAIETLRGEGVAIEAVLIEKMDHGDALRLKATCHATFDSFFLGIQGSGLEAASMGQAVIAGDPEAVRDLEKLGIPCPYTYANDGAALLSALRRLATDPDYYRVEAARVGQYVRTHHDYPVVGARYRDLLLPSVAEARRGATDRR